VGRKSERQLFEAIVNTTSEFVGMSVEEVKFIDYFEACILAVRRSDEIICNFDFTETILKVLTIN
jgi:hypothetical protein